MQKEGEYTGCKWFMRKGDNFVERASQHIPNKVTAEILHKFRHLAYRSITKVA
jgi:hypothetical protein